MAERLNVNITLVRNGKTGEVTEFFAYSGAVEEQISAGHRFTAEFNGMMSGPAVGATPAERMQYAENQVRAEIQIRLDNTKAVAAKTPTFAAVKPDNG
jgi:hypothetical protein